MNDDWFNILRDYAYQRSVDSKLSTMDIYNLLTQLQDNIRKDNDMAYTYNSRSSWLQDTRGDEVATAVLEAYAKGIPFDTLLKKNTQVRLYWKQILADKEHKEKQRIREQERLAKLAEKRALEKAKKDEVLAKLTDEELEAFGFMKNKKKVTKR